MKRLLGAETIGVPLIAAVLVLGVAACGEGGEDATADVEAGRPAGFKATPEYLAAAIEDLEAVPHRFEMTIQMGVEIDGDFRGPDPSGVTGAFDGERQHVRMDIGGLTGWGDDGGRTEQIVDLAGNALYVRGTYSAELTEAMSVLGAGEYLEALGELGDRWGRADLAALADVLPENWRSQLSQIRLQNLDPIAFLDLIAGAESVEELGTAEVQGEPMTGLAATVTAADISEAQGRSTSVTEPNVEAEPGALGDLLASLEYEVEAWIDHDGYVRRLGLDQGDAMEQLMEETDTYESDTYGSDTLSAFTFTLTLDLFDYGDESIEVEVPDAADTVDITAAVRGMYEAQPNP